MAFRKIGLFAFAALLLGGTLFAASDWETAAELRKNDEIEKAEKLLQKYSSPAGFEQLKPAEKIEFLRGLLELAHIRALRDDVAGALALLNWAESRTDAYQRSIACVKYAEILLDLGEFDRAKGYLKNADELIQSRATDKETGAAIGQGGEKVDTGGAWRELRDESDALKAEIESEEMKAKFGATYGSYVKLRRLQQVAKRARLPRYRNEALKIADEIIDSDPASQFAAAAGYLKGELLASRLKEDTPKKEIKEVKDYLDKFVKTQPDGLYRGEALMLLGKISLEIEWNAKDAEKYYTAALDYFRKAREKRDAVSLYAAINDDLKSQTEPTQKPTTLNQWKRIVYLDEDPLKLYNTANAPAWYVDDKEKNCLLTLGLLLIVNRKFEQAEKYIRQGCELDADIMALEASQFPNMMQRLTVACRQGFVISDPAEQKGLTDSERLRVIYGEFIYLAERFDEAVEYWKNLQKRDVSPHCRALALIGEADCLRMLPDCDSSLVNNLYGTVLKDKEMSKTPMRARAMYNTAWATLQASSKNRLAANELFEQCRTKTQGTKYAEASLYYLVTINLKADRKLAERYVREYRKDYPKGIYLERINRRMNQPREGAEQK